MAESSSTGRQRLADRMDRRTATIIGALLTALVLLMLAVPGVRGGEPPWDGELGPLSLPPHLRASVAEGVDLDEVAPVRETDIRVFTQDEWVEDPDVEGWRSATWVSLSLGQFGRWLEATGAPASLVAAALTGTDRPLTLPVPGAGVGASDGSNNLASAVIVNDRHGRHRVLQWDPGTSYAELVVTDQASDRLDQDHLEGVRNYTESILDAAAMPHRAWAMRLRDAAGSPVTRVQLWPAVPPTDVEDTEAVAMTGLPGVEIQLVELVDGGYKVIGMYASVASWTHQERPSEFNADWSPGQSGDTAAAVDGPNGPFRVRPSGPSAATDLPIPLGDGGMLSGVEEVVGQTGLEDLVVVDAEHPDADVLDVLPPLLCRDIPDSAVSALLPGHFGPQLNPIDVTYPDVPYADLCMWQADGGFLTVELFAGTEIAPPDPADGFWADVFDVGGGATAGMIPQDDPDMVGYTVVWPGEAIRMTGIARHQGWDGDFGAVRTFLEAVGSTFGPDDFNRELGDTIREFVDQ